MKTTLLFIFLLPLFAIGQINSGYLPNIKNTDSLYNSLMYRQIKASDYQLGFGTLEPAHRITIAGDGKTRLNIDFKGDSMIVTGDMRLTEGAKKFIDYCRQYFKTKIDSLEMELKKEREPKEILRISGSVGLMPLGFTPSQKMDVYGTITTPDTTEFGMGYITPYTPKLDTIPVIMLVSDTTRNTYHEKRYEGYEGGRAHYSYKTVTEQNNDCFWQNSYSVRSVEHITMSTDNWGTIDRNHPIYSHIKYLDANKKPMKAGVVIWMSKEVTK